LSKNIMSFNIRKVKIVRQVNFETLRDAISSTLDIYLSSLRNKMNEVIKVLLFAGAGAGS